VAALVLCAGSPTYADQRVTLAGNEVSIYNLAGSLTVEPGTEDQVVVDVRPKGRYGGLLQVESGPIDGLTSLRVKYPNDRVVYSEMTMFSSTTLRVAADGRFGPAVKTKGSHIVQVLSGGAGLDAHADLYVSVPPGKRVNLHIGAGSATVSHISGELSIEMDDGPITVEHMNGKLSVRAGSGGLRLNDLDGEIVLDSGSGKVGLTSVRGSQLTIDAGSGSVTGVDVEVNRLSADTGSGTLRIDNLRADEISVDNGSGDVSLDLQSDISALDVDAGSGDVTVTCPKALGAAFEIQVGSGAVQIEPPHEVVNQTNHLLRGRIGDGRGRIHVDSGSGSVRFMRRSSVGSRLGHGAGRFFGYPFE